MVQKDRVLVLGAGLSGLAATDKLLAAGLSVTVVDSFPLPGGRFASFEVPTEVAGLSKGDVVEHGLHAFFQHYHGLYGLMARCGLEKPPFAGDGVYFWNPRDGHYQVEGGPLFWLLRSLGLPEEIRGARGEALAALARLTTTLSASLKRTQETDQERAIDWLDRFGVPRAAVDHVFRPCMYSLTSLPLEDLSALELMRWMSAILPDPRMRALQGGGSQALCLPITEALRARGADFRFGVEVHRIGYGEDGRVQVAMEVAPDRTGLRHILVEGFEPAQPPASDEFDAVVCTLPWEKVMALSDTTLKQRIPNVFDGLAKLHNIHPLTVRLWFERPLVDTGERYILSAGTVFDVLRPTPEPHRPDGIYLVDALVENIDAHLPELGYDVERYVDPGAKESHVLDRVMGDLERLYPGQILGNRLRARFVHTREGIVACNPGVWAHRPPAHVGLPNLVLAGDYTQQPFGVCMEGATRSGQLAADALLSGRPVVPRRSAFGQVAYSAYSLFVRS